MPNGESVGRPHNTSNKITDATKHQTQRNSGRNQIAHTDNRFIVLTSK